MEFLHVAVIVTSLDILDAKSCYFLKKTFNWDWNRFQYGLNQTSPSTLYKTTLSSVYCSYDEICCGQSCCPNPSFTPKYYYETYNYQYDSSDDDSRLSTGSSLGLAFAIVIGLSFFASCCIACLKKQENQRQNMTVRNVHPVVAYSSDSGAVIIRQAPRENLSSSSSASSSSVMGDNCDHDTSQPYRASETYGSSSQDTRGNIPPHYGSENPLQNSEPPPSYEYVMSHKYLSYTDNKSDSAKTINEPEN